MGSPDLSATSRGLLRTLRDVTEMTFFEGVSARELVKNAYAERTDTGLRITADGLSYAEADLSRQRATLD